MVLKFKKSMKNENKIHYVGEKDQFDHFELELLMIA